MNIINLRNVLVALVTLFLFSATLTYAYTHERTRVEAVQVTPTVNVQKTSSERPALVPVEKPVVKEVVPPTKRVTVCGERVAEQKRIYAEKIGELRENCKPEEGESRKICEKRIDEQQRIYNLKIVELAKTCEKRLFFEERSSDVRNKAQQTRTQVQEVDSNGKTIRKGVNVQERIEERGEKLDERRKARIRAYVGRLLKRMDAALLRFEMFSDRINSRIAKFNERGVDTTEAERLLSEAHDDIINARAELQNVQDELEVALESENPKKAFRTARASFVSARDLIKEVHASLVRVIRALKGSTSGNEGE